MSNTQQINKLIIGMLGVFGIFQLIHIPSITLLSEEGAAILQLAYSIADTFSYSIHGEPHTSILPGYPVFIAFLYLLCGKCLTFFIAANIIGGVLFLISAYALICRLENMFVAVVGAFLLATSPLFFALVTVDLLPDFVFACLLNTSLFLIVFIESLEASKRRTYVYILSFLLILFSMFSFFSLSLVLAILFSRSLGLLRPRQKAFLTQKPVFWGVIVSLIFTSVWLFCNFFSLEYGSFSGPLTQISRFSELLFHQNYIAPHWYSPVVLFPLLALLAGLWKCFREESIVVGTLSFYLLMLFFWPLDSARYLIPIFPLMLLYILRGGAFLLGEVFQLKKQNRVMLLVFSVLCLLFSFFSIFFIQDKIHLQDYYSLSFWLLLFLLFAWVKLQKVEAPSCFLRMVETIKMGELPPIIGVVFVCLFMFSFGKGLVSQSDFAARDSYRLAQAKNYQKLGAWLRANLSRESIVMSNSPYLIGYFVKVKAVKFPKLQNPSAIIKQMSSQRVSHLIVNLTCSNADKNDFEILPSRCLYNEESFYNKLVSKYPSLLKKVYEQDGLIVFEVNVVSS